MTEALIRFGGADAEYLTLSVHGRSIPEAADYWDGNFLWCTAEVAAGAFRGSLSNLIRNEDLARFLPRLETLYQRLDGVALFDTHDGWLNVQVVGVGRGQMEVRGQIVDDPVNGNQLEFRLAIDQTYLPPIIAQVRAAVEAFPVVGSPDAETGRL